MNFKEIIKFYKKLLSGRKIRKYFLFSSLSFLFFGIFGFFYSQSNPELTRIFFDSLLEKYLFAKDYNFWQLFLYIFQNNLTIAFIAYLSGVVFGLPTLIILITNSFVIGLVLEVARGEMNLPMILLSLLPHGIFEIPAILLALSLGFIVGDALFAYLFKRKAPKILLLLTLKLFFYLVIPLLFMAALIESSLIAFFS